MGLTLPAGKSSVASIHPKDKFGNDAQVQAGSVAWAASDPAILTAEPADDGLTCRFRSVGPEGTAQAQCSADADLGDGTTTITELGDVEVIAGDATGLGIQFGPVED